MSLLNRIMNPVFALIALDAVDRQLNSSILANPQLGFKLPLAAREAMSLTFTLFRLKISSRFTKGLPFGIGTIANFAIRISGLQLALSRIGIFFDPANYAPVQSPLTAPGLPGGPTGYYPPLPGGQFQQYALTSQAFNLGDYVCVTTGIDSGKCGSIQTLDPITISGVFNSFQPSEVRRG